MSIKELNALTDICDMVMPRYKQCPKKAVYWWPAEIEAARSACSKVRRKFQRARRRKLRDPRHEEQLYRQYRLLVKNLQLLIREAKPNNNKTRLTRTRGFDRIE